MILILGSIPSYCQNLNQPNIQQPMLKGYYSNFEIAKIVCACKSIEELMKVGRALVDLHTDYEILDIRFFELMSHKKIKRLITNTK